MATRNAAPVDRARPETTGLAGMENDSLVMDLVEWIAAGPRTYEDVMDAWRTSCPRLTIWEDAVDAGLVKVRFDGPAGKVVTVTDKGRESLRQARRS